MREGDAGTNTLDIHVIVTALLGVQGELSIPFCSFFFLLYQSLCLWRSYMFMIEQNVFVVRNADFLEA